MQRKERLKELQNSLKKLQEELIFDEEKLRRFADAWCAGLRSYSFHNTLLILAQGGSICAGFNQWKKLGRHVKAGEKAVWILAPFVFKKKEKQVNENGEEIEVETEHVYFSPVPVFDISQTEGKPLELGCAEMVKGEHVSLEKLISAFPGYRVSIKEHAIENGSANGSEITLTRRENELSMAATLLHEIAHIELGHAQGAALSDGEAIQRNVRELEAEAVSYISCALLGIKNERSKYYIASWSKNATEALELRAGRILSVAEKIVRRCLQCASSCKAEEAPASY